MKFKPTTAIPFLALLTACNSSNHTLDVSVIQTSSQGDQLKTITPPTTSENTTNVVELYPQKKFQTITGFGGAFTESSAFVLNQLEPSKRSEVLEAYFGESGARYSLTRTHMNSCDFSLGHYSYAPVPNDTNLAHFSIEEDMDDLVPLIKDAQKVSKEGFKIIASPWTAPPWMKDNNDWYGGKLETKYYATWASFFSKYAKAYKKEGIDIWAFTVENEPLGNDSHWESMHYTPEETALFVKEHLGPQLRNDKIESHILVFDQNRDHELKKWSETLLTDTSVLPYIYGTAVHWYSHTADWRPGALEAVHELAPDKHIVHTEGCVDSEIPHWKDDAWYWKKEATDWGWDWAKEEDKKDHPKYVPVYRYARDIIGCMNSWVEGWVDWNMVLDTKGGPNLAQNWCVAPVIADTSTGEVYYTPLYYTLSHFSRYIRPGAVRIGFDSNHDGLMVTAVQNPDKSIVLVALNMTQEPISFDVKIENKKTTVSIPKEAVQTIIINR